MPSSDQIFSISCTVVGVGPGGSTSMLAYVWHFCLIAMVEADHRCSRVAITDFRGRTIYDRFVAPTMAVTDYRTATTGITPALLGIYFATAPLVYY